MKNADPVGTDTSGLRPLVSDLKRWAKKTVRTILFICVTVFAVTGCAKKEVPFGVGGQKAKFGDYSRSEVEALRTSLAKLTFPVPEHTVAKMLPRHVEPLAVEFVDGFAPGDGISGGMAVEYWLNDRYVLKVATAYHTKGDSHFSLEEWAVILTREERDHYTRRIY